MRIRMRAACAAIAALTSLLALSCNNSFGILQTIQGEKAQNGTSIFQETAVFNAFRLGSNYYAVTGGTLQVCAVGKDSWSSVPIVSGGYALRGAVLAGSYMSGTIFALIETGGEANLTVSVYSSSDGSTWTQVSNLPADNPTGSTTQESTVESLDALYTAGVYRLRGVPQLRSTIPTAPIQNGASTLHALLLLSGQRQLQADRLRSSASERSRPFAASSTMARTIGSPREDRLRVAISVTNDHTGFTDPAGETGIISGYISSAGWSTSAGVTSGWTIWVISFTGDAYGDPAVYISTKGGYLIQYEPGASSASVEACQQLGSPHPGHELFLPPRAIPLS